MSKPLEKAITGAALIAAGFFTGGTSWLYLAGTNLVLAGGAQYLQKNPRGGRRNQRATEVNFGGEDTAIYRVYGETKVGGHLSIMGLSTDKRDLYYSVTHSVANACGIDAITDVWIGERKVDDTEIDGNGDVTGTSIYKGLVRVKRYLGTSSETADPDLVANVSYVTSTARGDYLAKTVWRFRNDVSDDDTDEAFQTAFPNGPPIVQAALRGQRCYDPRKDSTNGGSGSHRLDDPDTWEFTRNPILQAVDYALAAGNIGGVHVDVDLIDWGSVAVAASICDEPVLVPDGGGTASQARYTSDIALDTEEDTRTNIEKILSSCLGAVVYASGKIKFHAGAYEAPATTIDHTWIAGGVTVQHKPAIGQSYNSVRSVFIDPHADYASVQSVPFVNAAYIAQDGDNQIWKDIEWAGVQDPYLAQYLNIILGRMSRNQKTVIAQLNMRGLDIEPWEIVELDFPDLNVSGSFRVSAWDWTDIGPRVTFEEVKPDTYDMEVNELQPVNYGSRPADQFPVPPVPTGLTATPTIDGIALKWTNPGLHEYTAIEIERSADASTGWERVHSTRSDGWTDPVTDGALWYYRVRARNRTQRSGYSLITGATALMVADKLAGRGVNVMHPRYSSFEELSLPPCGTNNVTLAQNTFSAAVYHGAKSLSITRSATGNANVFLSPSTTTYNLALPPSKLIVSIAARESAGNVQTGQKIRVRLRKADGSYVGSFESRALSFTMTRHSGVIDLSAQSSVETYNLSVWLEDEAGTDTYDVGDTVIVDAIMIEEQYGNETTPSGYVSPVGTVGASAVPTDTAGRVLDSRYLQAITTLNRNSWQTSAPLQGVCTPALTGEIHVAAHTVTAGSVTLSFPAGAVFSLNRDTTYYVYADVPANGDLSGVVYQATTSYPTTLNNTYRYYVGKCVIPRDPGTLNGDRGAGVSIPP